MTASLQSVPEGHYGVRQVARSELLKIVTLRSSAATLGFTVVASLLVTALVAHASLHHSPQWYEGFDPTQESLTGMVIAALTAGVFGALLITGEYSSGTIRTTLTATPRRPVLLAAKIGVTAILTLVVSEVLSFVAFWFGQAILVGGAPSASITSGTALRAVTLTGVCIALLALLAFGFGLVLRSTAGAIAAFAGVVFVLPLVMHAIAPSGVRYLPTNIFVTSIMSTVSQGPRTAVSPAVGLCLMAVYAAIPLAAGAVQFLQRDA